MRRIHWRTWRSLAGVCLCAMVLSGLAGRPAPIEAGQVAPAFTLPDLAGNPVSFSEMRGAVSLVLFWASWCGPCMQEMPEVQAMFEQYRDQGFQVVAVNFGESKTTAQKTVDQLGVTFPVLLDRWGNVAAEYRVMGLPLSFFVDGEGVVHERIFGRALTQKEIEQRVQRHLRTVRG